MYPKTFFVSVIEWCIPQIFFLPFFLRSRQTLDALYGHATGSVTLNGIDLTDEIFKAHCYVVKQHDKHWPYLTCRETLAYAAELYDVVDKADLDALVDEIIRKMGMESCADTRNSALSGGQRRRLCECQ